MEHKLESDEAMSGLNVVGPNEDFWFKIDDTDIESFRVDDDIFFNMLI